MSHAGGGDGPGGGPHPRTAWKSVFFALAAIAIVAGAAWALLGSRFLVVRSVQVSITGPLVSRDQVIKAARIPLGLPLIRVNSTVIAHRVERITQVQSAQVSKHWPHTVVITVRARTPVFALRVPQGFALLDRFGVDVRGVAHRPPAMPLLTVGAATAAGETPPSSLRGNPAVNAAAAVLHELPGPVARKVRTVTAASASNISVRLTHAVVVVWGDPLHAAAKARELTVLMRAPARLYDVSGPGTLVTKG